MKKNARYCRPVFLFFLFVLSGLTACKKSSTDNTHSPFDSKFSFTYNGTHYVLPFKQGTAEWGVSPGIYINRPDIFNGTIHFPYANCAYLDPQTYGLPISAGANCELSASGFPIDSVAVYLYHGGSYNISYKNCYKKKEFSIISGNTIEFQICDANGTFDLTLKNKENKTIVITGGTFEMYNFRR